MPTCGWACTTLYDLYRYPTQHFDYHRQQLTLPLRG